jgi:reactive intermediate/imine deaminase
MPLLKILCLLSLLVLTAGCVSSVAEPRPRSAHYLLNDEGLPFSDAVQVGETVYLSGVLGLGPDGELVKGGIGPQMTQTLENLRSTLHRSGSSLAHVAKCTVILADLKDFSAMNEVYRRFFPADRLPARTTFVAKALVLNARVEVECVAIVAR